MKTPYFTMTPDYTPVVRMMAMQTRFAVETTQKMFEMALIPWKGMPTPYGVMRAGLCVSNPAAAKAMSGAPATVDDVVKEARKAAEKAEAVIEAAAEKTEFAAKAQTEAVETVVETAPEAVEPVTETAPEAVEAVTETAPEAVEAEALKPAAQKPAAAVENAVAAVEEAVKDTTAALVEPMKMAAPEGTADDLTALNGVGPKLAEALNAQGIWHYRQIAGWTEANVAWVDENLPGVRGRASRNGWVGQATALDK